MFIRLSYLLRFFVAGLLAVSLSAGECLAAGLSPADQTRLRQALDFHQSGQISDAIHIYEELIQTYPDDPQLARELGVLWFENQNYDEALRCFHQSQQLDPNHPETAFYLGQTYMGSGEMTFAKVYFEEAARLDSNHLGAYYGLGLILDMEGNPRAEQLFKTVLAKDPSVVDAHFHLGSIYYADGRYVKAEEQFEQVLSFKPNDVSASYNLGLARLQQGKWETARDAFRKADQTGQPAQSKAQYQIAYTYEAQRFYDEAKERYRSVIYLDPTDLDARERLEALEQGQSIGFGPTQTERYPDRELQASRPGQLAYETVTAQSKYGPLLGNTGAFERTQDPRTGGYMLQSGIAVLSELVRIWNQRRA